MVEGARDAIGARSGGLSAVAVPGVRAWESEWVSLFKKHRQVFVVMNYDASGPRAAVLIAGVIDLAPERDDGFA